MTARTGGATAMASTAHVSERPKSLADLKSGALAGREFDNMRQFAVAAVSTHRNSSLGYVHA